MMDHKVYFEIFGACVDFGWNVLENLPVHIDRLGTKKALIVTDGGVASLGIPERVAGVLKKIDVDGVIFDSVLPNPTDGNLHDGARIYQESGCDFIIGVGGGSPMDAAKGIQVYSSHPEPFDQYFGADGAEKIVNQMPPCIAIPTTSGTGSETSRGAIITDTPKNVKRVIRSGMPTLALVDPALTVGMPPTLTATTGMDALSHNIEALLSNLYHPAAEAIAIEGIRLVAENLVDAAADGENSQARTHMAMASSMGAIAFQKGLGVTHSLAHQLSPEFGVHHGLANAILLPHTMAFNSDAARDKMTRIAFAMGERSPSPETAVEAVSRLNQTLGLPQKLSEVNVTKDGIPLMAKNAMDDWCHPRNARPCAEADMKDLLFKAL
jgi:4-hydroxybutyrate dehydrogenase